MRENLDHKALFIELGIAAGIPADLLSELWDTADVDASELDERAALEKRVNQILENYFERALNDGHARPN